jgi:hypothetical protein
VLLICGAGTVKGNQVEFRFKGGFAEGAWTATKQ